MKKRMSFILSIALVGILVLAACASPATPNEAPVVEAPAVVEPTEVEAAQPTAAAQESVEASSDKDIESLILEKIMGSDHSLDFILSQDKTREEWSSTLDRMIGYGAKISPEEKETLIDWLVSR